MIDAGSVGIKAVWVDAEARQSADRFYADMKRKRDEAMGGAAGAPAVGGTTPGAWRASGVWGGNNVLTNPGGWRTGPTPNWLQPGGGGGGGQGGGLGGAGGIPPWLYGWQSPLPQQQQQIPPWLLGWRSPINPGGGGGQGGGRGLGRGFGFFRPLAAAYLAIRGTEAALRQVDRAEALEYTSRISGPTAALEEEASNIRSDMADPIGRRIRGFLASDNMTRRFFTSDEERRETNDMARNSVKDVRAGIQRAAARRDADADVAMENQRANLFSIRDTTESRLAQSTNTYENKKIELDNRLQAMRDQLTIEDDPKEAARIKAMIASTERSNAKILYAAGRVRASEDAEIRRDAVVNSRALQSDVEAAKLEYQDRPRAAGAQRIFGKTREAFEKQTDKEGAQDILRIGRLELMNMQKDINRRGFGEQFDPTTAAFGVRQTGKEDSAELSEKIGQLIQAINNWMPGLK